MGNTCAACSEEKQMNALSFGIKEEESETPSVKGNLDNHLEKRRNLEKEYDDYSGDSEPDLTHKPLSDQAVQTSNMNPYADKAKEIVKDLEEFKLSLKEDPATSSNPTLGPYLYPNGDTYKGQYFRGDREGYGEIVSKGGEVYYGQWDKDQMHGRGRYVFKTGCLYEGDFVAGKFEGKGEFHDAELGSKYVGKFKDGFQHGSGIETYKDGSVYEGQFKESAKHGMGILKLPDGGKYSGDFKDDLIDGNGKVDFWPIFKLC